MKTRILFLLLFCAFLSNAQFLHFKANEGEALATNEGLKNYTNYKDFFKLYAPTTEGFSLFQSNVFLFQSNEVNVYSELVADNIGKFRVSLGSHINSSKESDLKDQTIESLLNGGGNAVLSGISTFGYHKSSYSTMCFALNPKLGFQLPVMGSQTENVTFNAQLSAQLYLDFFSENNKLKLFSIFSASQIIGSNELYDNLGIERKSFFLSQANFGIIIENKWRIMATYPIASTYGSLVRRPVSIGTQILIDK